MSIILKGIDMPKEKDEALLLLILGDGTVAEKIGSDRYEEMTDTQAIQIPTPHGRLIDGDKLCYEFIDWQYTEAPDHLNTKEGRMVTDHERQYEIYLALGEAVIEIANAPTILEAEE